MRSIALATAILAISIGQVSLAPAFAQQNGVPAIKTNKKDLGEELFKAMRSGDSEKPSVATSAPDTPSQSGGFGSSVSGFFSSLIPGGKDGPAAGAGPVRQVIEGTARADDANVLEVRKADGSITKVRQWGLEAPETSQFPWGPRARGELDRVLAASGGKVRCTSDGSTTRSGNLVARCFAGETDISAKLIEGGYGIEWREVSGGAYTQLEKTAQAGKRGVWEAR
jgi:endonuclease YncB( thermonuclease family)